MKLGNPTFADDPLNLTVPRINQVWETDHRPDGHHKDIYQHGRTLAVGHWKQMPYDSTDYTAQTGNWTVDRAEAVVYYMRVGGRANGTMVISFQITSTDVSSTPTDLRFRLPENCIVLRTTRNLYLVRDAGTFATTPGLATATAGNNYVSLFVEGSGGTNWTTTAADDTDVYGQIICNVRDPQL